MSSLFCLALILGSLCWCNCGVIQDREKRSQQCGRNYRGMDSLRGDVKLWVEEFNNTGVLMYRPNQDCSWTFDTEEPGTYIMLTTVYFRLEMSDDCIFDYVEITEYGDHEFISRFCDWNNVTYISASNNIKVAFHSDVSYQDKGFEFKYEIKRKDAADESKCNNVVLGPDPGEISGSGSTCYYSLRSDEGDVVELDITQLDFGGRSCDEERIEIYKGLAGQIKPLMTFCSFNSTGFIGVREPALFVAYHHIGDFSSGGFKMAYSFAPSSNFPTTPAPTTVPSPIGGDSDCSGVITDPVNGEYTYTAPTFQDNRKCNFVIKNTLLRNHVIEVKFVKFDLEESDECEFDSLKVMAGEDEDSKLLGGSHGKHYCGQELKGRTLTTNGDSLRMEFKTDESLSFYGFKAVIKFVPNNICKCERPGTVCVRTGMEKLCEPGSACSLKCQNGGKCVRHQGESRCVCRTGFSGESCTQGEGGLELLEFEKSPEDRELARGETVHHEECKAKVVDGDAHIEYIWTFDGEPVSHYTEERGFGTLHGGVLKFTKFNDQMEGTYSCIAETESGSRIEHVFEYKLVENCPAGIDLGPKDKDKRVGETVTLECYAPTAASVVWKRNGRLIDTDHEPRFSKMTNNYLKIEQLEELDSATYRCEAKSRTGCVGYREAKLTVLDVTSLNNYCGITIHSDVSTRISQGRVADPTAYPWHVVFRGIKKNQENYEETFCGGSLISARYVLTAAHCIEDFGKKFGQDFGSNSVRLYIGSNDCYGTRGTRRLPAKIHLHPNYQHAAYQDSDIALIELDSPVEYTNRIRPVCLQEETYIQRAFFSGVKMTFGKVAGCGENWRKTKESDLQEIKLPYVEKEKCEDMVQRYRAKPNSRRNFRLTEQMFCAGNDVRRTGDTCKGDSGGAMVMAAQNRWIQTGIVSFGIGCDSGNYGIYTNVAKFYDWIKDITQFHKEVIENNRERH